MGPGDHVPDPGQARRLAVIVDEGAAGRGRTEAPGPEADRRSRCRRRRRSGGGSSLPDDGGRLLVTERARRPGTCALTTARSTAGSRSACATRSRVSRLSRLFPRVGSRSRARSALGVRRSPAHASSLTREPGTVQNRDQARAQERGKQPGANPPEGGETRQSPPSRSALPPRLRACELRAGRAGRAEGCLRRFNADCGHAHAPPRRTRARAR